MAGQRKPSFPSIAVGWTIRMLLRRARRTGESRLTGCPEGIVDGSAFEHTRLHESAAWFRHCRPCVLLMVDVGRFASFVRGGANCSALLVEMIAVPGVLRERVA